MRTLHSNSSIITSPQPAWKRSRLSHYFVVSLLLVFCLLFISSPLLAQTCSQCYEQASQAGAKASRAIDKGILVLLLPTLCFFAGVIIHAFRRANVHQ